jgi:hypothetical protein
MPDPIGRSIRPPRTPSSVGPARTGGAADPQGPAAAGPATGVSRAGHVIADGVDGARSRSVTEAPTSASRTASGTDGRALADGVAFVSGGLVVDGRRSRVDAGVTEVATRALQAAATRLLSLEQNGFMKLTARDRTELASHLTTFLATDVVNARPSQKALRARASSFALLTELVSSMRTQTEKPRARALVDTLLAAVANEKHAPLKRQMSVALQALPKSILLAAQVRAVDDAKTHALPARPPYEAWFPEGKPPKLVVKQYVQDEFWKSEIAEYRRQGYTVTLASDGKSAVAKRTIEDPKGKAPPTEITVDLIEADAAVFRDMNDDDVHVVFYTGHANLGAVAKWSLDDKTGEKGQKLIGLFACRTQQNLAAVRREYDDAHVLVSRLGTYGHDDRIAIHALFEGIAARTDYETIGKRLKKSDMWEKDNYFLPHDSRQLDNADLDGDGAVDRSGTRIDTLYNVDTKRGDGERITMKPARASADLERRVGHHVVDAVQWFNTVWHYWAEDSGSRAENALGDRFRANGWFTSADPNEIVRVDETRGQDGKPEFRVAVNAAYADQSADALAMMVCFELSLRTQAETRPDESLHTRRMRALAMVGSYVWNLVEDPDMADHLMRTFAKRFGFPDGLTWPVVEKALMTDSKKEASDKVVRALEKGMQFPFLEVNPARSTVEFREYVGRALEHLRKGGTEIGMRTFELVTSGQVKLDELADLTRGDFNHIRKEFAREGVDLPVEDYARLHDERAKATRAITTSVNGYMWDDRIYVARDLPVALLARTIVHEVNHVVNRSEENYRGEKGIFVEEYRAHYAEALLDKKNVRDPDVCRAIKLGIIRDYALKTMKPEDLPDVPPGILIPPLV